MQLTLSEIRSALTRTPETLRVLLGGLPDEWIRANEGPETFSPFDVLGHLIAGEETDWIPRVRRILEDGESKPFDPFDRFAMYEATRGKSAAELLDRFVEARRENLSALDALNLTDEQLELRGLHPGLGSVTLGQLLATWVMHDISHVTQISRVMSKQLGDSIGPWREYFSVFRDASAA